jgi:hypothetical protein
MLLKDALSLSFSIFALLISAVTAYFNLFLQTDDLGVLVEGYTKLTFEDKTKKIIPHLDYTMTFVNAGNRAASVSRMYYSIEQLKGEDWTSSCQSAGVSWDIFAVEPFAVKANDLLIQKAIYKEPGSSFENRNGIWTGDKLTILVCLGFNVVAPNSARKLIAIEADRTFLDIRLSQPKMPEINFDRDRLPVVLLKRHAS